ncbi:MAG: single-stranded DNA-binding protein [Myxococcales bacterium]|nr:single-stranded DNA-binding protein [Myxococcales bacterium]
MDIARRVRSATRKLSKEVSQLSFADPVTHVYNPLVYASRSHDDYIARYAARKKRVIFLGMNPGPYGMSQTGVPFGEVNWVRDWLEIEQPVDRPQYEHPKRPVTGFACTRSEVSGDRVWSSIAAHFKTPKRFFAKHYIANYCPLVFMEESGRNRTPDKLPRDERDALFEICDRHLRRLVEILEPKWVIGIGAFATKRAELALAGSGPRIAAVLHPSPANPRANANWRGVVGQQLVELGLCKCPD